MLCIYHGDDEFSLREELAALKAELDSDGMLASNTSALDGRHLQPGDLLVPCGTVPFLGSHRLVVVEGLLARFEAPRSQGRRRDEKGSRDSTAPWKSLPALLPDLPETTTLVLIDGKLGGGNPLLKLLAPLATVREFRPLRQREVPEWIRTRARTTGISISPGAVNLLADLIGNDLRLLVQELDKLSMYARERQVEEDDVHSLVSGAREASVFNMVDAAVEGRGDLAVRLVQQLQAEGASPTYLLTMIIRQYRHLILAKELLLARLSASEIGQRLGINSDFALRKVLEQATRYPLPRLEAAYHSLLEADAAIKNGTYGEELALDILLADLTMKPSAAPTRP
ncbi:MAG: DNA polymerase III subunit delta [Dehalococcoidia bacterium]|jgi:DNA polymerase-3 subunit delta